MGKVSPLYFDRDDHQLLSIVKDVLERGHDSQTLRSLLVEHMHPQGIKEIAAPRGLRIAYAIASLLGSFEKGTSIERLKALRSVRDEVFLSTPTFYQKNTARVLLQIAKELLRNDGDEISQLKLAHDFRMASAGTPRLVREQLDKYHLLEMPESWDQYAFDDHVHDANTKGRKSPTHLIMDAWIKGIRFLTVAYYNYVSPEVVEELIEASSILDIRVQVGIEMSSHFRDRYVRFTWEPHGFNDNRAFLAFLKEETVIKLMEEGRKISTYQQQYVFNVLDAFNNQHRLTLNEEIGISLEPLPHDGFLQLVGVGQPSLLHLSRYIYNAVTQCYRVKNNTELPNNHETTDDKIISSAQQQENLKALSVDGIIKRFLQPSRNPEIHDPTLPQEGSGVPDLLKYSTTKLIGRLLSLNSSSKIVLNLSSLSIQDTLELLYTCKGMITHIESYNLRDADHGITSGRGLEMQLYAGETVDLRSPEKHYRLIGDLQRALNEDNVIDLKRAIRSIIWDYEEQCLRLKEYISLLVKQNKDAAMANLEYQQMLDRKEELLEILYNLEKFHNWYKKRTLGSHISSRSTGQSEHQHGMGLVVLETLPARAQKKVREGIAGKDRTLIPVSAMLTRNSHSRYHDTSLLNKQRSLFAKFPFFSNARHTKWDDWSLDGLIVHPGTAGNIATLGGLCQNGENNRLSTTGNNVKRFNNPLKYLNTHLKNTLKVVVGFIPAFLTFYLTKDWWLLAYFGAFIWFGITGSRNIIQSVLGGGGLKRSPLLPWNSLVSWSRISDSLLYTGFSVPLLDFLVKTLLLDQTLGITTATNPILLYAVMGLANGIYISSHNIFRGLPRNAAVGNFFRSILAIPLAVAVNAVIGSFLQVGGVVDVSDILQKWAAIISKFASDCVAAIIEGMVDRQTNIRAMLSGYRTKISQLFAVFSRLDLLFPEEDVLDILQSPKMMIETLNYEAKDQETLIIVNALDLMYFWMYQPRARKALNIIFQQMTHEEWLIFYRSQLVLKRYREISQVFVDGLVGKNFSKALSFYLDQSSQYLRDLEKLDTKRKETVSH